MSDLPPIPGADAKDGWPRDEFNLTPLQRRFCDCYLELLGEGVGKGIKQQAALNAGYQPQNAPNAAWQNLRHPECVKYIASQMAAATAKVPVDRSYVLFKALQVVERAEAKGMEMAVMRALELIARHVDVAALIGSKAGDDGAAMGAGLTIPIDLSTYSTDEKRLLLDLVTRHSHDSGRLSGHPAPVDRRGRSDGEAGPA